MLENPKKDEHPLKEELHALLWDEIQKKIPRNLNFIRKTYVTREIERAVNEIVLGKFDAGLDRIELLEKKKKITNQERVELEEIVGNWVNSFPREVENLYGITREGELRSEWVSKHKNSTDEAKIVPMPQVLPGENLDSTSAKQPETPDFKKSHDQLPITDITNISTDEESPAVKDTTTAEKNLNLYLESAKNKSLPQSQNIPQKEPVEIITDKEIKNKKPNFNLIGETIPFEEMLVTSTKTHADLTGEQKKIDPPITINEPRDKDPQQAILSTEMPQHEKKTTQKGSEKVATLPMKDEEWEAFSKEDGRVSWERINNIVWKLKNGIPVDQLSDKEQEIYTYAKDEIEKRVTHKPLSEYPPSGVIALGPYTWVPMKHLRGKFLYKTINNENIEKVVEVSEQKAFNETELRALLERAQNEPFEGVARAPVAPKKQVAPTQTKKIEPAPVQTSTLSPQPESKKLVSEYMRLEKNVARIAAENEQIEKRIAILKAQKKEIEVLRARNEELEKLLKNQTTTSEEKEIQKTEQKTTPEEKPEVTAAREALQKEFRETEAKQNEKTFSPKELEEELSHEIRRFLLTHHYGTLDSGIRLMPATNDTMILSGKIRWGTVPVEIRATIRNRRDGIIVEDTQINAPIFSISGKTRQTLEGIMINLPENLQAYYGQVFKKTVESMTLRSGQLKMTFKE